MKTNSRSRPKRRKFHRGTAKLPIYIARFEGGELDGRMQPMYGKNRLKPREVIEMGAWYNNATRRVVDHYVCLTPHKRIETMGEERVYRFEPNYVLGLEGA